MAVTLNLQDARIEDVHAGLSPLAELMAVLHILAEPDHHPEAQRLMSELTAELDPVLRNELRELSPLWARLRFRLLFPLQLPAAQDGGWPGLVELVDHIADGVFGLMQPRRTIRRSSCPSAPTTAGF